MRKGAIASLGIALGLGCNGTVELALEGSEEDSAEGATGTDAENTGEDSDGVDAETGTPGACEAVDLLFVVDNTGSMTGEQASLIAAFPAFLGSLQAEVVPSLDLNLMVVDSDAWVFESCEVTCELLGECMENPDSYFCGAPCANDGQCAGLGAETCDVAFCEDTETQPLECEDLLGASVIHPRGANATNEDCAFSSGTRFIRSTDPATIVSEFACAARVGTGSVVEPERPMDAMVEAVASSDPSVQACNAGFLREEALLVVVFLTNEDDNEGDGSSGSPPAWRQALVEAKGGNEAAVVMLGIFGQPECGDLDTQESLRLTVFVELFGGRGLIGSSCADDYGPFFESAVGVVASACDAL